MNDLGVLRSQVRSGNSEAALAQAPQRRAILILGMHRSGTSALAGVVSALGAAAPKTLMPANAHNPRGYFESTALAEAHDALLASLESRWQDWRQLNSDWIGSEAGVKGRQRIKQLLLEEFGDEPLIVVKDPRMCRFVAFIASIFAEMGIRLYAMLPVRNPLEVALSLHKRDEVSPAETVLLWLRHVLDAELQSRSLPRVFISYDNLLADWRHELDRAAEILGIAWPNPSNYPDTGIDRFLTADLRHQSVLPRQLKDHQDIVALARETYEIMSALTAGGASPHALAHLDRIRARFNDACEIFGPAMAAEQSAADALRGQLSARAAQAEQIRQKSEAVAAAQATLAAERDALIGERDNLAAAHGALTAERDALIGERDSLAAAHAALTAEHGALAAAHDALSADRDNLASAHSELIGRHEALGRYFGEVSAQREALGRAYRDVAAECDALRASRSWRWTALLRGLRQRLVR